MTFDINGEELHLSPTGSIFLKKYETLFLSDLHIGKAGHFRKNGVAISGKVNQNNFWNLSGDIQKYKPEQVIFLGDLFHSKINKECHDFSDFVANYPDISWVLVEGNHDILHPEFYAQCNIEVHQEGWKWESFYLTHEPLMNCDQFNIAGHIHPGIRLKGKGRQSIRLSCFYFHNRGLILPAYGDFTGRHVVKPKKGETVFALVGDDVLKV